MVTIESLISYYERVKKGSKNNQNNREYVKRIDVDFDKLSKRRGIRIVLWNSSYQEYGLEEAEEISELLSRFGY